MAIVIPTGFAQVTFNYDSEIFASGKGATVLGVTIQNTGSLNDTLAAVMSAWGTMVVKHMVNVITMTSTVLVTSSSRLESAAPFQGDNTFALPPPNSALLVRKVTSGRGRRHQGRMFLPGLVAEADVDSAGNLTGGTRQTMQGFLNDFMTNLDVNGIVPVILHDDEGESEVPSPSIISEFLVEPKMATQRRRLR